MKLACPDRSIYIFTFAFITPNCFSTYFWDILLVLLEILYIHIS